jgi:hypothetical protein
MIAGRRDDSAVASLLTRWRDEAGRRDDPMTARQTVLVVASLGIPVAFFAGLIVGVTSASSQKPPPEAWQISPEFRRYDVDRMFADYKAGRVIYTVMLPVLGTRVRARVVHNRYSGGDFGFVPMGEIGDLPTQLWYLKRSQFELKKYDDETLFVRIDSRYVIELSGNPSESRYSTEPVEEKR